MQQDNRGDVTYSDTPLGNGEQIITPDSVDFASTPSSSQGTSKEGKANQTGKEDTSNKKPYTSFTITSPADGETIQNQPTLNVDMKLVPDLQKGDVIMVYLDGQAAGKPASSTHIQLGQLERGTHQLSAELFDESGQSVIQAKPITIYVQRVSAAISPAFHTN
jgi:hypothetical protein